MSTARSNEVEKRKIGLLNLEENDDSSNKVMAPRSLEYRKVEKHEGFEKKFGSLYGESNR